MSCCRSPALQGAAGGRDCSARRRCPSRSRWRAAAPTRWRCASAPILAYPVRWRTRLAGAAGGAALILGLNTLRIGTLGRAAASPAWFNALHVYVWPARAHARDRRIRVRLDAPRGSPRTRSAAATVAPRRRRWPRAPATVATIRRAHGGVSAPVSRRLAALSRESRRPRAGRLHRPRGRGDRSASSASARTPRPTCSGRRAAASSSRRSASPRR